MSGPPGKFARKTSSKSFFTIGESSTLPPGERWWQIADSTPVSSVMSASTWTWPPFAPARTSEIWGGLVSSARAEKARHSAMTPRMVEGRMPEEYRTSGGDQRGTGTTFRPIYAAAVAPCCDSLTDTVLEIPGSSMVTP